VNSDQLRMARALLRLTTIELAEAAGIDKMSIVRFEAGRSARTLTVKKLKAALEARGVVFLGAIEPFTEPTVALKFGTSAPAIEEDEDENGDDEGIPEDVSKLLKEYWSRPENKQRLSPRGQQALLSEGI
jgi:transcriptional regulator with XRE-family HTH domain